MNRNIFLVDLRKSLTFMTAEERDETLRYYEELFDEAGPDNEQQVIDDLGSPTKVAVTIHREYSQGRTEPSGIELMLRGAGSAPEKAASPVLPNPPAAPELPEAAAPAAEAAASTEAETQPAEAETPSVPDAQTVPAAEAGPAADGQAPQPESPPAEEVPPQTETPPADGQTPRPEGAPAPEPGPVPQASPYAPPPGNRSGMPGWGIALILVFSCWLWLPILAAVVGVALGILAALLGVGVVLLAAGAALGIAAIWALGFVPDALLLFGAGAIALAIGLVALWFAIWVCVWAVRGLIRGVSALWRALFGGKKHKEGTK